MKYRRILSLVMAALLIVMSFAGCGSGEEKGYKMGTAGTGGTYYAYGNKVAQLLEDDMKISVQTTAGSAANLRLLDSGFIDMAIVQSDVLAAAVDGSGVFGGKKYGGFACVAGLYTEAVQIVVKADSGIEKIRDLKGKIVNVGEEESGVLQNAQQILKSCGLSFDDITPSHLSFTDAAQALEDGIIDAFFITAGAPTAAISDVSEKIDIAILNMDNGEIDVITDLYSGYTKCTIPAGTYKGIDEDVTTIGVKAVLMVRDDLPDSTVAALVSQLFANAKELKEFSPIDGELTEKFAAEGIPCAFHPGCAEYYDACGITVDTEGMGSGHGVSGGQDD